MANRSRTPQRLVEPSWDRTGASGQGAEPAWREPSTTQARRPAQPPRHESSSGAEGPSPRRGHWPALKLALAVVGLCVAAGLLWSMADVAREQVARGAAPGAGQAFSGSAR